MLAATFAPRASSSSAFDRVLFYGTGGYAWIPDADRGVRDDRLDLSGWARDSLALLDAIDGVARGLST